jgi:hypothetical protein
MVWLFLSVVLVLIVTNAGFRRFATWAASGVAVLLVLSVVLVVSYRSTAQTHPLSNTELHQRACASGYASIDNHGWVCEENVASGRASDPFAGSPFFHPSTDPNWRP